MDDTSVTSPGTVPALPERWAEEIFRRMENRYGARWVDAMGGIDRTRMRQAWAEELAGYTPDEIARGLDGCRVKPWPPSLPEFLLLCRPLLSARAEWEEARVQMAERLRCRESDVWSRPQVYWAAVAIGNYDLQTLPWENVRARWEYALSSASADDVPPYQAPARALPSPGAQTVTRDEAMRRTHGIIERMSAEFPTDSIRAGKQWAVDLMHKEAEGQPVAVVAQKAWREALGYSPGVAAQDVLASVRRAA